MSIKKIIQPRLYNVFFTSIVLRVNILCHLVKIIFIRIVIGISLDNHTNLIDLTTDWIYFKKKLILSQSN